RREPQRDGEESDAAVQHVADEDLALQLLVARARTVRGRDARLATATELPGGGDDEEDAEDGETTDDGDRRRDPRVDRKDARDHACPPTGATQKGPSGSCPVLFVPRGGPTTRLPVSIVRMLPESVSGNRSSPRGAGPSLYSPARLYFEPWQGHSNHCDAWQNGTRQPRCTHRWYSAISPPASSPAFLYVPALSFAGS